MELQLSSFNVQIICGVIIPVIVATLTKYAAPPKLKASVTLVLSGAVALLSSLQGADGGVSLTEEIIVNFAVTQVVAIASYLGVFKPLDLNAKMMPQRGLGGSSAGEG